ncbi:MAG: hypothetical protein ACPGNT_07715 [Rhodospirillales bacterium]
MTPRVLVLLAWLLLAAGWAGPAAAETPGLLGQSLPPDFRPFHPESAWNKPIAVDAPVYPLSAAIMKRMAEVAGPLKADSARWSIPLYVVDADKARRDTVWFTKDPNPLVDQLGVGFVEGVPLPPGIEPDPEDDGHMLVVDPKKMVSWDLSRARYVRGKGWEASRFDVWDLTGMGERRPFTGPTWWTYGARGSGFPLIAGLVRPEQILLGEINQALVFASPLTRKSSGPEGPKELCPPASRTDGTVTGPDSIPMGARLQLDPDLDLDSLNLSPEVRVIARALQVYGMFNGDTTHDVFKIYFQNLGRSSLAWVGMDFSSLKNIPLDRFRMLDCPLAFK